MNVTINFDMDGTLANFYGVSNWLDCLINSDPTPYAEAKPLFRFSALARILNNLQRKGYRLAVISWLSKSSTTEFDEAVTAVKLNWLKQHLPSVQWDEITIVPYGTPKQLFAHSAQDVLFDDEQQNRENWTGIAYSADNILETLKTF